MKDQPITSKFTSVNSSKLPRIYNHIDWSQLKYDKIWCKNAFSHLKSNFTPLIVYDWGCGRYPEVIGDFFKLLIMMANISKKPICTSIFGTL